jgi:hypothetical protein
MSAVMRIRDVLGNDLVTRFTCAVETLDPLIISCEPRYTHSVAIYFALDTPADRPIIGAQIRSIETARKYLPKVWQWPLPLPTIHGYNLCVAGRCSSRRAYYTTADGGVVFLDAWSTYAFFDRMRREAEAVLGGPKSL